MVSIKAASLFMLMCCAFAFSDGVLAQNQNDSSYAPKFQTLPAQSLDKLVSPIALYPDPLLAQIMPAAGYPDQIAEAADWLRVNDPSALDEPTWDPSVIALAHYPSVIKMMNSNMAWTRQLGQAYLIQPQDVFDSVQRMRRLARDKGNLVDTEQQKVVVAGDNIQVVPASTEVIYVPVYEPTVVYTEPANTYAPLVTFGAGLAIGSLIADSHHDDDHYYYYGGPAYSYPYPYHPPVNGWGRYYETPTGHGEAYRGSGPAGYGAATTYEGSRNGNDRTVNAAAGRTWDGGAYAGHSSSTDWDSGAETASRRNAYVSPSGNAYANRGWAGEYGDTKVAGGSRTVVTDEGAYRVSAAGSSKDGVASGGVRVSGINSEGDYGSKTWSSNNRNSSYGSGSTARSSSNNVFQGSQSWGSATAASSRGYQSRAGGYSGGGSRGGYSGGGGRRR